MNLEIDRRKVTYRVWHLPHEGDAESLYEDNYHPKLSYWRRTSSGKIRFAVADGVSGAYFSGGWASLLTLVFQRGGAPLFTNENLQKLAEIWKEEEISKLQNSSTRKESIRKLLEKKIHQVGGSSTINGVELDLDTETWNGFSIGDSCMFQIRNLEIVNQNPQIDFTEFGYQPEQILTVNPRNWRAETNSDSFKNGDMFLLSTDAFARWLLTPHEDYSTEEKIREVNAILSHEEFVKFITRERRERRMEDDDVTVSIITITGEKQNLRSIPHYISCKRLKTKYLRKGGY